MGTFINTYGTPSIPKDKLPEFRARTLAIAEQGGMMTLSHITMFGRHLTLLKPVEAGKYACIDFYYNYFEEECWENAGFSSETQCLYSNKIGRRIFNRVMRALYILQELYSEAPCFPHIDGQLFDATDELGWLNYLFKANFANNRVPALNRDTFHLESEGKPVPPIGTAAFWWQMTSAPIGGASMCNSARRWSLGLRCCGRNIRKLQPTLAPLPPIIRRFLWPHWNGRRRSVAPISLPMLLKNLWAIPPSEMCRPQSFWPPA